MAAIFMNMPLNVRFAAFHSTSVVTSTTQVLGIAMEIWAVGYNLCF